MRLIHCSEERHAEAILDIFNHAILNSTALYDYKPREPSSMVEWFAGKRRGNLPVIGYEDEQGRLLGFAGYGPFRDRRPTSTASSTRSTCTTNVAAWAWASACWAI